MKTKTLLPLTILLFLLAAYLYANKTNPRHIFRTPTPVLSEVEGATATQTSTPTPTLTFTPTPTETLSWSYLDDDSDGVLNYADNCPQKYAATSNGCPQNDGGNSDACVVDCGPPDTGQD